MLPTHITANGRHGIKITAEGLPSKVVVLTAARSPGNDFDEGNLLNIKLAPFKCLTFCLVKKYSVTALLL